MTKKSSLPGRINRRHNSAGRTIKHLDRKERLLGNVFTINLYTYKISNEWIFTND